MIIKSTIRKLMGLELTDKIKENAKVGARTNGLVYVRIYSKVSDNYQVFRYNKLKTGSSQTVNAKGHMNPYVLKKYSSTNGNLQNTLIFDKCGGITLKLYEMSAFKSHKKLVKERPSEIPESYN